MLQLDLEKLEEYLDKAKNPNRTNLEIVVKKHGKLNDVDYYLECQERYFPKNTFVNGIYEVEIINNEKENKNVQTF